VAYEENSLRVISVLDIAIIATESCAH